MILSNFLQFSRKTTNFVQGSVYIAFKQEQKGLKMNVKDRQIALHYLKNVTNSEYEPEDLDLFFHQLSRYSVDLFGFCLRDLLNVGEKRVSSHDKSDFVINLLNGKLYRNSLLAEDDAYKKVRDIFDARKSDYNVDITAPDFDKNFTIICDTFDLPNDCRNLLQCLIYMKKNSQMRRLLGCFNNGISNDFMDDINADFVSFIVSFTNSFASLSTGCCSKKSKAI